MPFALRFSAEGRDDFDELKGNAALTKHFKAVSAALGKLQINPRHPGLKTHKYLTMKGPHGADAFEAYAENNTPGAYRIFWSYGPGKDVITIIAITPHP